MQQFMKKSHFPFPVKNNVKPVYPVVKAKALTEDTE